MPDRLMKALAALQHGVMSLTLDGRTFYAIKMTKTEELAVLWQRVGGEHSTPIEALAAAADALGLVPNLAIEALTEEERALLNDALSDYAAAASERADLPYNTGGTTREFWRRTAEQAESLRQRLCGDGVSLAIFSCTADESGPAPEPVVVVLTDEEKDALEFAIFILENLVRHKDLRADEEVKKPRPNMDLISYFRESGEKVRQRIAHLKSLLARLADGGAKHVGEARDPLG